MTDKIMKRGKRAISPLIATVLLIVVSIALFGVIFMWLRGMIAETVLKFDQPVATACGNVVFTATFDGADKISITNQGNIPIIGMNIQIQTSGKKLTKSIVKPLDGVISVAEIDYITVTNDYFQGNSFASAEKRTVAPIIVGQTEKNALRNYVCKDKAVII